MRKIVFLLAMVVLVSALLYSPAAQALPTQGQEKEEEAHVWEHSSTNYETVQVGSHEFDYWKNFLRYSRTCDVSHKLMTVVYYCDVHDHTASETHIEDVVHSHKHN